ncbi:MAG: YihY/virulence factor BrkB family protein [Sumerlaeia bacterium]
MMEPDSEKTIVKQTKKTSKKSSISRAKNYLREGIWNQRVEDLPLRERYNINFLRVITLSVRHFLENKCMLRASALTFYSLLSIVPVVAMLLGVAKGFGFEENLKKQITSALSAAPDVASRITSFADKQIQNTSGGVIAGVGILILFFTVVRMIGNIEDSLNDIWNVKEQRSFARKLSDYLSLVVVSPIVLVMSSSITVFLSNNTTTLYEKIPMMEFLSGPTQFLIRLTPVLLLTLLLTFIYAYLPNHKIRSFAAFAGGLTAAILFQLFQVGYVKFQGSMTTYNAIYGSLAALPLFMLYLQVSWSLLLFGAEVSYATQNASSLEFKGKLDNISDFQRSEISLAIVAESIRHFSVGEKGPSSFDLSNTLHTPEGYINQLLEELVSVGILSKLASEIDGTTRYQPGLDINKLTVNMVLTRMRQLGTSDVPLLEKDSVKAIRNALKDIAETTENSPGNVLIKELL